MFDESEMAPIVLSIIMVNTVIFYSKKGTIDLSKIQNIKLKRELRNLDIVNSRGMKLNTRDNSRLP